jgi:hypothetical protein
VRKNPKNRRCCLQLKRFQLLGSPRTEKISITRHAARLARQAQVSGAIKSR